jgi:hypothetical protein
MIWMRACIWAVCSADCCNGSVDQEDVSCSCTDHVAAFERLLLDVERGVEYPLLMLLFL